MAEPHEPTPSGKRPLLRNHGGGHAPVSNLELFFDLVYVFAITQLSHTLLHHLSWMGLLEAACLFLAVWWAWIYTAWVTNWTDPERGPVRLMLIAVMLGSLLVSVSLPDAFGETGLLFAASYVGVQLGRSLVTVLIMRGEDRGAARNMVRIAFWFALPAPLWIAGAMADPHGTRIALWFAALLIEYLGPVMWFRTPGLGRSTPGDWNISGSHMAERGGLIVIIALGEGIVVTGANFAEATHDPAHVMAFLLAFVGSVLMWWVYFDTGAQRGAEHIEHHAEAGKVARAAYTYLHMPIVAGIVVSAVADALLLEEPAAHTEPGLVLTQCGGLLVYLVGNALFKRFSSPLRVFPPSHLAGCLLLGVAGLWAWLMQPPALAFVSATVCVIALVAVWEWGSYHGGWKSRLAQG